MVEIVIYMINSAFIVVKDLFFYRINVQKRILNLLSITIINN